MTSPTPPAPWTPASWRQFPAAQQPEWPDADALKRCDAGCTAVPPLVFAGEARRLSVALAEVADGRAFLLQAGDCAESFADFSADAIREQLKILLQMAAVLTYGAGVPVLKVGRIAGQFVKPRSPATEQIGDVELAVFRGHMVHDDAPRPRPASPTRSGWSRATTTRPRRSTSCAPSPRAASPT